MKKWAFVLTALLAACGGGGGSGPIPGPVVTPTIAPTATPTPTAAPHVLYSWSGALAPGGSVKNQSIRRMTIGSAPIPVQASMCDPRTADCLPLSSSNTGATDTNPTIQITDSGSPAPSASPDLTLPNGLTAVPQPAATPFSYMLGVQSSAGCSSIGAAFSNATGSVPVCAFPVFTVGCIPSLSTQPGGGYDTSVAGGFNLDTHSYTTDIASSDVYVTGETCPGVFNETETAAKVYVVHFPYGATAVSFAQYSVATANPTDWTNAFTTLPLNQDQGGGPCGGNLACLLLVKSSSGTIYAMQATRLWASYDGNPTGAAYLGDWFTMTYSSNVGGSFAH